MTPDTGRRLENAVFLALRWGGATLSYAAEKDSWECDFLTDREAIQVCAELTPHNREREVSGAAIVTMGRRTLDKDPNQIGVDIMEDEKIEGPLPANTRKDLVEFCKKKLSVKERYILMMYYSEDLTLKEIGQILDLSESRVCQLHAKDRKSTRLNSSHSAKSRMPSSA